MRENANHMQITRASGFKAQTADAVAVKSPASVSPKLSSLL